MPTGSPLTRLRRDLSNAAVRVLLLATIESEGPLHGYRLRQVLESKMEHPQGFRASTIYPVLEEYVDNGLLLSRWGSGPAGPQRKYFEITPKGRKALAVAAAEWSHWRNRLEAILPREETGGNRPSEVVLEVPQVRVATRRRG